MGFFNFIYDFIVFSGATVLGVGGAFYITSLFVYTKTESILKEAEEEEQNFEEIYREEFDQLEAKERAPNEEIAEYESSVETPIGDIIMTYDPELNTFLYYSDRRTIPIRFLDVCAQKFVIDHDCKILYEEEALSEQGEEDESQTDQTKLSQEPEPEQGYYNWITSFFSNQKVEEENEKEEEEEEEEEESVFATYKKKTINKEKARLIEKIMNRYKYCGTLNDYETNKENEQEEELQISFCKFKEMVKNKTE